jgi:hypothetical protein
VLLPAILALLSLAAGGYGFATTTLMVIRGWSSVPHSDQWDNLIFSADQVFSPWLYARHNEHRIVFPRLLFAIDTFAFAETNKFNLFCNVALALGVATLVIYVAHRHISRSIADTVWIAGIALAVLFSAMQFENFIWGVELAAMASIACIVFRRRDTLDVTAGIAFAAIAVYTLASGILVSFIAIPLAVWIGRSWKQVAALTAAVLVLLGSYLPGYVTPPDHSDPLITALKPGVHVIVWLGNPFGQPFQSFYSGSFNHWEACFGVVGLGLFATAAVIHLRSGASSSVPLWFRVIHRRGYCFGCRW